MTSNARELRVRETVAALVMGHAVGEEQYQELRSHLIGFLRSKFSNLPTVVAVDEVDEGITRLLARAKSGDVHPETALAFVRRIVYNLAVDHFRRGRYEGGSLDDAGPQLLSDDAIAQLIHESATVDSVERLLAEAATRHDFVTTRVINAYLNLAGSLGRDPSSRNVAAKAEVSHTTVLKVLAKLKEHLSGEDFPD